jgi:hypothetical protein
MPRACKGSNARTESDAPGSNPSRSWNKGFISILNHMITIWTSNLLGYVIHGDVLSFVSSLLS